MGFSDVNENVGGVPVEVTTTRRETVYIEMESGVRLIERILEDKAIETAKQAMNEYSASLMLPWVWYEENLTVSTKEIVDEMEGPNSFPLTVLIGGSGLLKWEYAHDWLTDNGYMTEQWAGVLGVPIKAPSFLEALEMWDDALTDKEDK